ncbi:hypothetical protein Dsin_020205 [Dipteronia sinensis]|uniref:Uncharacterized protein n=1 Tax=Dipteronia sinensis TaxID=43782 RepID=A0AAE0E4R4_9ROSI|nr:hypothetical protein Dsin_020205 [Dipteronia sinensis]
MARLHLVAKKRIVGNLIQYMEILNEMRMLFIFLICIIMSRRHLSKKKNCGALDGTYIKVNVLASDRPRYWIRKNEIATNMLGVVLPDMQFIMFCLDGRVQLLTLEFYEMLYLGRMGLKFHKDITYYAILGIPMVKLPIILGVTAAALVIFFVSLGSLAILRQQKKSAAIAAADTTGQATYKRGNGPNGEAMGPWAYQ